MVVPSTRSDVDVLVDAGYRARRPAVVVGRAGGVAPRGTRTSLTTRPTRAGRPPLGGIRTGVVIRTKPGLGRGTRPPPRVRLRAGWRRTGGRRPETALRPGGARRGRAPGGPGPARRAARGRASVPARSPRPPPGRARPGRPARPRRYASRS